LGENQVVNFQLIEGIFGFGFHLGLVENIGIFSVLKFFLTKNFSFIVSKFFDFKIFAENKKLDKHPKRTSSQ